MNLLTVQDGDTITIRHLPTEPIIQRIRLAGIDAPEKGELLWNASRDRLIKIMCEQPLRIEVGPRQEDRLDPCSRTVAWVWAGTLLVQEQMVMCGLAVEWSPFGPCRYAARVLAAQVFAQERKLGVWAMPSHRLCHVYGCEHKRRISSHS